MKVVILFTDAEVRTILTDYLKEHGPTRLKSLTTRAQTPYERSERVLNAMRDEGLVEQVAGGMWRGVPVLAWRMVGDTRMMPGVRDVKPKTGVERMSFAAHETLAAMQAAARGVLMQGRVYA